MGFVVFAFILIVLGVICIDHRLANLVKLQKELLKEIKDSAARNAVSEQHLRVMRRYYETPTPPPLPDEIEV